MPRGNEHGHPSASKSGFQEFLREVSSRIGGSALTRQAVGKRDSFD
jgi:hypothetical protein